MLRRCASCGRVGNDLVRDDFLDGWVCEVCPERATPDDVVAATAADAERAARLRRSSHRCERTTPDAVAAIAADITALTARVSEAETTASPTAAAALSKARRHLLRASVAVELAQEAKAWKDVADDLITKAQAEREEVPPMADIPTITPEMLEETKAEIAKRRAGGQGSSLKDIVDAPCPECGAHAVSFVDDLVFDEMIVGKQGVIPIRIPNLTGIRCSECGDYAFDPDASKKIMEAVQGAGE